MPKVKSRSKSKSKSKSKMKRVQFEDHDDSNTTELSTLIPRFLRYCLWIITLTVNMWMFVTFHFTLCILYLWHYPYLHSHSFSNHIFSIHLLLCFMTVLSLCRLVIGFLDQDACDGTENMMAMTTYAKVAGFMSVTFEAIALIEGTHDLVKCRVFYKLLAMIGGAVWSSATSECKSSLLGQVCIAWAGLQCCASWFRPRTPIQDKINIE